MLSFTWTFTPDAVARGVSDFSLGNLTIRGNQGESTSAGRVPDQAMMVFLSMVALLDGVRRFLDQKGKQPFVFYAVDSSYSFTITSTADSQLAVCADGKTIVLVSCAELAQAVWKGVQEALALPDLDPGSVAADLASASSAFRTSFPAETACALN